MIRKSWTIILSLLLFVIWVIPNWKHGDEIYVYPLILTLVVTTFTVLAVNIVCWYRCGKVNLLAVLYHFGLIGCTTIYFLWRSLA